MFSFSYIWLQLSQLLEWCWLCCVIHCFYTLKWRQHSMNIPYLYILKSSWANRWPIQCPSPIQNFFFFFLKMIIIQNQWTKSRNNISNITIAYPWYDGHSISISACEVWGVRVGVQVSKREIYTHIHLDYIEVEILS